MSDEARATARLKAEDKFAKAQQQERSFRKERERMQQGVDDKIARLRALRLSKEAADKAAAEEAAAAKRAAAQEAAERKAQLKAAGRAVKTRSDKTKAE